MPATALPLVTWVPQPKWLLTSRPSLPPFPCLGAPEAAVGSVAAAFLLALPVLSRPQPCAQPTPPLPCSIPTRAADSCLPTSRGGWYLPALRSGETLCPDPHPCYVCLPTAPPSLSWEWKGQPEPCSH